LGRLPDHIFLSVSLTRRHALGGFPGLIDSFLGPLLENDLKTGALTHEQAQEFVRCLPAHIGDGIIMFPKPNNDQLIEESQAGKDVV
jgi:hypothetical protein